MTEEEYSRQRELQDRERVFQRELQRQKDRAEIANQLVRGGLVMNGGGAIALLAFIQASITAERFEALAHWAAASILLFVVGLSLVTAANRVRIQVSKGEEAMADLSWSLQIGPTVMFGIGCVVFAIGVFTSLGAGQP